MLWNLLCFYNIVGALIDTNVWSLGSGSMGVCPNMIVDLIPEKYDPFYKTISYNDQLRHTFSFGKVTLPTCLLL